jgi:hypothetical protein
MTRSRLGPSSRSGIPRIVRVGRRWPGIRGTPRAAVEPRSSARGAAWRALPIRSSVYSRQAPVSGASDTPALSRSAGDGDGNGGTCIARVDADGRPVKAAKWLPRRRSRRPAERCRLTSFPYRLFQRLPVTSGLALAPPGTRPRASPWGTAVFAVGPALASPVISLPAMARSTGVPARCGAWGADRVH